MFAPVTLTTKFAASPVTRLRLASRTVITTVVRLPAVPAGTTAVVCAALAAPGATILLYGPPPIGDVFSVIARLSVPVVVGV